MKKYIFITYSSHDVVTTTQIKDYLENKGVRRRMALLDIPVGEECVEVINKTVFFYMKGLSSLLPCFIDSVRIVQ